jgi:maleate cis-trans isomerase
VHSILGLGQESSYAVHSIADSDVLTVVEQAVGTESSADGVYVFGGGLRSLDVLGPIEQLTRRPAVSSNAASAWVARTLIGLPATVEGCGRLLA